MKYHAIATCKDEFSILSLCDVFEVSRSGYYEWVQREPSKREKQDVELTQHIKLIAKANRYVYGVPRIHAELQEQGIRIGRKRVARLMKMADIQVKQPKPFKPRNTIADKDHRFSPNRLNREFEASRPDEKWLVDITYISTREGWLYVAGVLDMFSRRIVGLAMDDHMTTSLVKRAFNMAWQSRKPDAGLLHHSDRGSQYTSDEYQTLLSGLDITLSMSHTGQCLDNSPIESFWSTLKRECASFTFDTRSQARATIFDYVMTFYNRTRRHSSLGYISPEQFEHNSMRQIMCP